MTTSPFPKAAGRSMDRDAAEALALRALAFIVADPRALQGMMRVTGMTPEALREAPGDVESLAGIIDYLLGDERRLLEFCEASGLSPDAPLRARSVLPGWKDAD